MSFNGYSMEYYSSYRRFHKDMKEWESTPPKAYGEYLQKKRRKKKRNRK